MTIVLWCMKTATQADRTFSATYCFTACLCSSEGGKSCPWVNSSDKLPDGGFQFELSHPLPPYAEESTMLEVTAEAITNFLYVRRTESFYLRDIGKLIDTVPHETDDYQEETV